MKLKMSVVAQISLISLCLCVSSAFCADEWFDTFYQYRVPVVIEAEKAGWNGVPISTDAIVSAINRLEEMRYDPLWFDY